MLIVNNIVILTHAKQIVIYVLIRIIKDSMGN